MDQENNFHEKLNSMINACALQARWHHEQYARLQYCQQYFVYLLHNKRYLSKNYLEDFFQNLTDGVNTHEHPWGGPLIDHEDAGEQSSISDVHCKKKKRRKKKRKTSKQEEASFVDNDNESESDLALDEGFKEFLRESARFRAERGLSFFFISVLFIIGITLLDHSNHYGINNSCRFAKDQDKHLDESHGDKYKTK